MHLESPIPRQHRCFTHPLLHFTTNKKRLMILIPLRRDNMSVSVVDARAAGGDGGGVYVLGGGEGMCSEEKSHVL